MPVRELTVVPPDELNAPGASGDVSRRVAFETDDALVVRSRVARGVTTGWHHNGDRSVDGYVVEGRARLEYGPAGERSATLAEGDVAYVPRERFVEW